MALPESVRWLPVEPALQDVLEDGDVLGADDAETFAEHKGGHRADANLVRPADPLVDLRAVRCGFERRAKLRLRQPALDADTDDRVYVADVNEVLEVRLEHSPMKDDGVAVLGGKLRCLQRQM